MNLPININDLLTARTLVARRYRNRRVGEFLKELEMTEGRNTGVPKILRAIKSNKSPAPRFETDPERTWFISEFLIHPVFMGKKVMSTPEVTPQVEKILRNLVVDMDRNELMRLIGLKDKEYFRKSYLKLAMDLGLIEMTIPDKPQSSKQKYRLTIKGKKMKARL